MALLGDKSIGSFITLKEDDKDVEYIVVHKGKPSSLYDDSCNGVWLLRAYADNSVYWASGTSTTNDYENSYIHKYLNDTYLNKYDDYLKNKIKEVKIPYKKGKGYDTTYGVLSGSYGLTTKVFLLGGYEVGLTQSYKNDVADCSQLPIDGAKLSYFSDDTSRICYKTGSATTRQWWLRSAKIGESTGNSVWNVYSDGTPICSASNTSTGYKYIRPAIILPTTFDLDEYASYGDSGSTGGSSGGDSGGSSSGNIVGIKSLVQTTISTDNGGINVWTATLTDGTTSTFEVRNGSKGDKGDKGDKGEKGDTGLQGEQGIQGEKGDKGDKGDKGEQGIQGIQGEKGEKGDRGEQGLQGIKGDKGDKGDTGATGLQGERGADGVGISDITQKGSSLVVSLSDGTSKTFRLPTATTSSSGSGSSCGCNHSSVSSGCSCGSGSSGNSRCISYDVQKWGENWLLFDESGEYSLTMDENVNMTIYLVGGGSDGEDGIYYNRTAYGGDGGKGGMVNIIRDIKVPKGQADIDVIIGERGNFGGTYVVINNNGYCCNSSGYTINDGGFQGISGKYAFRNAGNGSNGIETPFGYVGSSGGGGAAYCNGKMSGYGKGGLYAGNGGKIVNGKSIAGDKAIGYGCGGGGGAASSTSWCKGGRGKRGCVIITWNT